jgi:hypothetical protein
VRAAAVARVKRAGAPALLHAAGARQLRRSR